MVVLKRLSAFSWVAEVLATPSAFPQVMGKARSRVVPEAVKNEHSTDDFSPDPLPGWEDQGRASPIPAPAAPQPGRFRRQSREWCGSAVPAPW